MTKTIYCICLDSGAPKSDKKRFYLRTVFGESHVTQNATRAQIDKIAAVLKELGNDVVDHSC